MINAHRGRLVRKDQLIFLLKLSDPLFHKMVGGRAVFLGDTSIFLGNLKDSERYTGYFCWLDKYFLGKL